MIFLMRKKCVKNNHRIRDFLAEIRKRSRHHTLSTSPTTTKHLFRMWPGVKPTYYCVVLFWTYSLIDSDETELKKWKKIVRKKHTSRGFWRRYHEQRRKLRSWVNVLNKHAIGPVFSTTTTARTTTIYVCVFSSTVPFKKDACFVGLNMKLMGGDTTDANLRAVFKSIEFLNRNALCFWGTRQFWRWKNTKRF